MIPIVSGPVSGELITHCGHLDDSPHHVFRNDVPMEFTRPDGSKLKSQWICLCTACFMEHREHPELAVREDAVWMGDDPMKLSGGFVN